MLSLIKKTQQTCVLLHHQSHITNQAVSFTDQERYRGVPQNSAQSQKCAVKIIEIKKEYTDPLQQLGRDSRIHTKMIIYMNA